MLCANFGAPSAAGATMAISWIPPFAVAVVAYGSKEPMQTVCSGSPWIGPECVASAQG
jgi:hypothetical protein